MIKKLMILIVFLTFKGFSQDFELRATPSIESEIIYNNGTTEKGMLWLASSAFSPRMENENKGGSKKIDYKKIDKIITNPDSENKRVFQYLHNNYNKFKIFVELIYTDKICIYIASKNNGTDLFYSDFDRETIREKLLKMKFENRTISGKLKNSDTLELPNGKKIVTPIRYSYYYGLNFGSAYGNSTSFQYYIQKEGSPKLMKVERNKRFLKKSKEYFTSCPSLIEDLEQNKITLSDLPTFIEYYKEKCGVEKE
ncbi:hypothetical protein [Thalassobellus citreus]|uniref:hypothetical protein n=1 Tax=Thalassobellus citreus TaxID=3367752 RepID=UPI0037954A02